MNIYMTSSDFLILKKDLTSNYGNSSGVWTHIHRDKSKNSELCTLYYRIL